MCPRASHKYKHVYAEPRTYLFMGMDVCLCMDTYMWPTHPTVLFYFFFGERIAKVDDIECAVMNDRRANTYLCLTKSEAHERKIRPPLTHYAREVTATRLGELAS